MPSGIVHAPLKSNYFEISQSGKPGLLISTQLKLVNC